MFLCSIKGHLQSEQLFLNPFMNHSSYRVWNSVRPKVNGESRLLSRHHREGWLIRGLLGSCIKTVANLGKVGCSVSILGWRQCVQQVMQGPVKPFLPISGWMIWGCVWLLKRSHCCRMRALSKLCPWSDWIFTMTPNLYPLVKPFHHQHLSHSESLFMHVKSWQYH